MSDVERVLAEQLPGHQVRSVVLLGEGLENVAYEVDGDLVVRFSKNGSALPEARLLAVVAEYSPLPVPEPVFATPDCLAYRKLPGTPLIDLKWRPDGAVAAALADFLAALHAIPVERVAELVYVDDEPLTTWRDDAAAAYPALGSEIPARFRPAVEEFLTAPPPAEPLARVFSHNDLGIEHVLVDPGTGAVTGVIDWSDSAVTDPAYDHGLLYRDLGPVALPRAAALRERAVFYARCSVFEDLTYGLESVREKYVTKCLRALPWLFGP